MLNKTIVMGRLTADVVLRRTQSGTAVASFTLAVDRDFKGQNGERETDFLNCVAWKGAAEFVSNYFQKGSLMVVSGRLQTRNFETQNGERRTATEIIAENVYFGGAKKETGNNLGAYEEPYEDEDFLPVDEDNIPF